MLWHCMVNAMPRAGSLTRTITTIYLDDDLREGLERVKARDGVPASEQIRRALRAWLEERKALVPQHDRRGVRTRARKK
jgi:metal-responsive CopG/Arc/MetJ family transcriptional regulator